jgi:Photosynthetic reaction centre cytochrome C subunit
MLRAIRCLCVLTLALPAIALAQENRPPRPNAEMKRISAALGVDCDHCHVQGNFPSDEKLPKRVARRMIEMTKAINAQSFPKHEVKEGESVLGRVTCMTCHQGQTAPK